MANRPSVLVIDEERGRLEALLERLEELGYVASTAEMPLELAGRSFAAVLLGWGAGAPGLALQLRARSQAPIIAVTSDRGEVPEGADDRLAWPASREVLAEALRRWVFGDEMLDDATVATMRRLRLIEHLYPAFIEVLPGQIAALGEALASGDRPAIRHCAHRLRGSSAQMGAVALARVLEEIEGKATRADGAIEVSSGDLEALVRMTIAALRRELSPPG